MLASKMCETNHRRNLLLVSGSSKRTPKENHADARDGATLMWRGRYASTYQAECAHSFTTVYTLVHTSMHEPIRSMKMHKTISTISPATLAVGIQCGINKLHCIPRSLQIDNKHMQLRTHKHSCDKLNTLALASLRVAQHFVAFL